MKLWSFFFQKVSRGEYNLEDDNINKIAANMDSEDFLAVISSELRDREFASKQQKTKILTNESINEPPSQARLNFDGFNDLPLSVPKAPSSEPIFNPFVDAEEVNIPLIATSAKPPESKEECAPPGEKKT